MGVLYDDAWNMCDINSTAVLLRNNLTNNVLSVRLWLAVFSIPFIRYVIRRYAMLYDVTLCCKTSRYIVRRYATL